MPQDFQVAGMNWVQPIAPADEGPMLQPCADSTSVSPARIDQRRPNAFAAACQIGFRTSEPLQGEGAARPEATEGLRPRLWLLARASEARAVTFVVAGLRRARCQTALAGWPG